MHAFLKTGSLAKASTSSTTESDHGKVEKKAIPTPWVEKYRPKSVDEVAYQDEVVAVLKKSLQGADVPNLLFYGPPGTGKTSTILAASRQLFGDMFRSRVLELNASDERGIQVIRDKVKTFAQLTASSVRADGKPCPPFKIIILDEADSMTSAAQSALRRTMEKESKTTRFCLICNYVSRIIEPLSSRCSKFRFKPLTKDIVIKKLKEICEKEEVRCDEDALQIIIETSEGDLRKAITTLQSAHRLKGAERITDKDIYEITGVIPQRWFDSLLEICASNNYDKLDEYVMLLIQEGFPASQLFNQLHDVILSSEMSDKAKAAIFERLSLCDFRLSDGADEYLQIMDLCTIITQAAAQ